MARGQLRVRIVGDDRDLRSKLKGSNRLLSTFKKGALGVAAAVAGIATFSVREFANFDDAMTKSLAIMGDVSDAMRGDMADAAREVGRTTKFSAEEAAESYFFLASAGMDAAQSIAALPQVAAFAQAGNFDMARATDLATDAQSALAMASDDAAENLEELTRVTDVFVAANTLANATVEEFSESMTSKGGAAVQALGKDIEEGTAILAVYADQGLKGSEAGTILARTLEGLADQARKQADAFDDLGVAVFDAEGEMRNTADIIGDLEQALDGMSTEQRRAELSQLGFNERAARGIEMLLGNSDALREYEEELRNAAGTTGDVADRQMESFKAQMGLVWDQIKDVALSIGEALMPALEAFGDWLQGSLPSITSWFDDVSGKFVDLATGAEESTDEVEHELGILDRRAIEIARSYETSLESMDYATLRNLHAAGVNIEQFREGADEEFGTVGGFMGRLWEAWKVVWDEDVKPWLLGTVVPWVEEEFAPALISAFFEAGKAAGNALGRGVNEAVAGLVDQLPAPLRSVLEGPQRMWNPDADLDIPSDVAGPSVGTGRPGESGTFGGRFHGGGLVPGRPGEEKWILAMAGETVWPTHDRRAMAGLADEAESRSMDDLRRLVPDVRVETSNGRTERLLEDLLDATRKARPPMQIQVGSRDDLPKVRQQLRMMDREATYE